MLQLARANTFDFLNKSRRMRPLPDPKSKLLIIYSSVTLFFVSVNGYAFKVESLAIEPPPSFFRAIATFFSGFSSPVYRTDGRMPVTLVGTTESFTIAAGLRYRLLDEENGSIYVRLLKPYPVQNTNNYIALNETSGSSDPLVYEAKISELKTFHRIWQQGLTVSTLLLPVKYRSSKDGSREDFTTDISVGPFIGYKFLTGKAYKQFFQAGFFAGPSLVRVLNSTGNPSLNSAVSSENLFGFTWGYGIVFNVNRFQIGYISGKDFLGANRSPRWEYEGQRWHSFAIGYSFLTN